MTMLCLQHKISNIPIIIMHSAVPDKVRGVRFGPPPNNKSLSVEWSRPQSDARILYYEIRYRSHTGSRSWQGPVTVTTEMVTIRSSLISSASYGVQVRAVSAIGAGPYSSEETVKGWFQHTHTHAHKHTHTHLLLPCSCPLWILGRTSSRDDATARDRCTWVLASLCPPL